ncbi:glucose-6-phosphate 1-dehydrogenase [Roseinatronobacter thiooxidans]|uniref:Glucose-6-phosphate 1-dehydrogenase n=1 Tax=Roseinatronobacter thiooxidans TaxID=121821 RepID=A0A2W7QLG8_9RHOB|nr:glucose-6-phosphate dehydrogenase [Roseinatronobacter thiooxidans]PZX48146.1 glucose-6-phosphate 1-dehydrogenase [Roseinatronobacter thiooxidans]
MVARVIPVEQFDLVIFGATGDLARRKILPGLYRRWKEGQIPEGSKIIGAARSEVARDDFREMVRAALQEFLDRKELVDDTIASFLDMLDYVTIDAKGDAGWDVLSNMMRADIVRAFYLSVAPALFGDIAKRLHTRGIADRNSRIVVEKPFGKDLATARALNAALAEYFHEDQIYRIDHYLGKETVQNLMAVRFANILFEPLWNSQFVDHVQITVAETVGVDGRGEYYDTSGAMRDMVQNHLMQLLCLIAMEPPHCFEPDAMRDEKLKVIRALDPMGPGEYVRGQYRGRGREDYLIDSGNPDSRTESFIAMKLHISNWRWKGTPFYLRTGKRLKSRVSEIAVTFKEPPHSIFGESNQWRENVLVIRLQPDEGMDLRVMIKEPGPGGMRLKDVALDMSFAEALGNDLDIPDAYERLIMDVIRGNQTLFMRGDEVEAAWAWVDPVIEGWEQRDDRPEAYEPGSTGPEGALMLMHKDGRRWREIR